ncbi:MAG: AAA family ATPase, partial [Alphaproteobacteria bacterium]|nr:AAA family ATPase [Alphaproteobacteria bacterium]
MQKNARAYVFAGMELLPEVLIPFVKERLDKARPRDWQRRQVELELNLHRRDGNVEWDQAALLRAIDLYWREAFASVLGRSERSMVNELREVRNGLSHNRHFSFDEAERALDTMCRLMDAVGATVVARRLRDMRDEITRKRLADSPQERGKAEDSTRRPRIMRDATTRKKLDLAPPGEAETAAPSAAAAAAPQNGFRQADFDAELCRMRAEARAAGHDKRRVVSRDLH